MSQSIHMKKQQITKIRNDQPSNNMAINPPRTLPSLNHELHKLPSLNLQSKVSLVSMHRDLLPSKRKLSSQSSKKNGKPPSGRSRKVVPSQEHNYEPFPQSTVNDLNKNDIDYSSISPPKSPCPLRSKQLNRGLEIDGRTDEDILEQCDALGIDPVKEPDLVYIAKEALKAPLPKNWKPVTNKDGEVFYFDTNTHESTWMHPCDTYYSKLLLKEREKISQQKSLMSNNEGGMMRKTSLGGLSPPKPIPDLPPPLQLNNKPPPLGPIGGPPLRPIGGHSLGPIGGTPLGSIGGRPGSLGALPPLKPISSLAKQPLPTLPPLGQGSQPLGLHRGPPLLSKFNDPLTPTRSKDENILIPASTKSGSDDIKGATGSGFGRSLDNYDEDMLYVSSFNRPKTNYNKMPTHSTDIFVDDDFDVEFDPNEESPITSSIEEQEEEDSIDEEIEEEEEEMVDESEKSSDTKFNNMLNDLSPTINNGDGRRSGRRIETSDFEKPMSPHQSPIRSPEHSPRPRAAKGLRTKGGVASPRQQNSNILNLPDLNRKHQEYTTSSIAAKMANTREIADLDRRHQETIEKMKQEHSEEIKQCTERYGEELQEEKNQLVKEKLRKIIILKDVYDVEYEMEKKKMEADHRERMETLKRNLREEEEEEEARLHEQKEDSLRAIKRKLNQQQQQKEETMVKDKDDAMAVLRNNIEKEKNELEQKLREEMASEINSERMELVKRNLKEQEVEQEEDVEQEAILRQKKQDNLKAIEIELNEEQQKEEEVLIKNKEEAIIALKNDIEKQKNELEKKLRQEMGDAIRELKKQQTQEMESEIDTELQKEEERLRQEMNDAIVTLKDKLEKERKELENKLIDAMATERKELLKKQQTEEMELTITKQQQDEEERLLKNKDKTITILKNNIEKEKKILEEKLRDEMATELEELKKQQTQEMELEIAQINKENDIEQYKIQLSEERHKTEEMINDFKTRQSEIKLTLEISTEELRSLQIDIEKEKTTLNELKKLNETISKEILKLQQEKHLLEDSLKTLMAEQKSLSIIPSSAHPQPVNYALQSIDNLVFTNPAANSTTVSGDCNMISSNSLTNKETLNSMSDGCRSRRGSGDMSCEGTSYRERVLHTLHVSELQSISIEPEIHVVKQPFNQYPLATTTSPPLYNGSKPLKQQQYSNSPVTSQQTPLPLQQYSNGPVTSQQTPLPLQQYSNGPVTSQQTPLPLQQYSNSPVTSQQTPLPLQQYSNGPVTSQQTPLPLQQYSNSPVTSQQTPLPLQQYSNSPVTSQQTPLPLQQYCNGPVAPLPLQHNSGILLHGSVQGRCNGYCNEIQKQQCCRVCCCSHYVTDNSLKNEKEQLHKDTIGKLEEDFKNGPVKRLEKIENMLNEMGREKVSEFTTDYDTSSQDEEIRYPHSHVVSTYQNHMGAAQESDNRNNPRPINGGKGRTINTQRSENCSKYSSRMIMEDLEDSSDVSDNISLKRYSPKAIGRTRLTHLHKQKRNVHNSQTGFKKLSQKHISPDASADEMTSGMSVTLEKISGQLGEVVYRLNEKDEKNSSGSLVRHRHDDERHSSRSTMRHRRDDKEEERWRYRKLEMDREMHDKFQSYLDQAAKDEELRRQTATSYIIYEPPVGKTRTDIAGQMLIQKQRDWLHEFRQNVPPLKRLPLVPGGSYRTRM